MAVEVFVETQRGSYTEGPSGYFSVPVDLVEDPSGSGLFLIPGSLVETAPGSGLYIIPVVEAIDFFAGDRSNLHGYTVQEDATPIDPGGMQGGVGQITFSFNDAADTYHLMQEVVTLSDTYTDKGRVQGTIRGLSGNDGQINVTADSALAIFNSDHIMPPMTGTLADVLQAYCDRIGVVKPLVVDAAIASRVVVYPGWNGNAWDKLKQIASREQIEFTLIYDTIVARPIHTVTAKVDLDLTRGFNIDNQSTSKLVEIAYYNNVWGSQQEVYPIPGEEPSIYTVDADETLTFEVQLSASLEHVNQPTCVSFVEDRPYPLTNGVYSVSGNDGLPVTPSQWTSQGGSVRVRITDDPSIIEITIQGASMQDYSPYRIAMSAGSSSFYNSLHITGRGVTWRRKTITLATGSTTAVTGEDIGTVVENPFVSSRSEAYNLGKQTVKAFAGNFGISGTTKAIAAGGEATQGFGNVAGARVKRDDAMFRITSATTTYGDVQYSADQDTRVFDFDPVWVGMTLADFDAQWSGKLVKDFNTQPLRRDEA